MIEDVANPFYSAVAQAVEAVARDRGFLLITASALEDAERERELVGALLRRRVDALLIVPAGPDHRYISGAARTVFLDRPPQGIEADTVLLDNLGGARSAVEHLIAHGHTRIACVADTAELYTMRERLDRLPRGARAPPGIEEDPVAASSPATTTRPPPQAAVERLLALPDERRPTALFAANNRNTVGALHALAERARPVALVGFDDFELADLLGTTVVRADPWRLGEQARRARLRPPRRRRPPAARDHRSRPS